MWPFRKKTALDPGNAGFNELPGTYKAVWQRKPMPDPGAQNYAWESLAMAQFAPSGPSVATRKPIISTMGQMYVGKAVVLNGIPTMAGGIVGQPLMDPNTPGGYTRQLPDGIAPMSAYNIVSTRNDPVGSNNPSPDHMR
jgi:hypothetical protein